MRTRAYAIVLTTLTLVLTTSSCNVFSPFDAPSSPESILAVATARANDGKCDEARDLLRTIRKPNNDELVALGWAYLCLAGATAPRVAESIYKYTSADNNLTVLGALAQTLLPMDTGKLEFVDQAIATFNRLTNERIDMQLGIAHLIRATAVLALQGGNAASTASLERDDVTISTCDTFAPTCTGAAGSGSCPAGISSTNITQFSGELSEALTRLQRAGVTSLSDLATRVVAGLGADEEIARCFIRSSVIPQ